MIDIFGQRLFVKGRPSLRSWMKEHSVMHAIEKQTLRKEMIADIKILSQVKKG